MRVVRELVGGAALTVAGALSACQGTNAAEALVVFNAAVLRAAGLEPLSPRRVVGQLPGGWEALVAP